MQLRSSSNLPLDLSTLFICCKLEDDSWNDHSTVDGAVGATDWRASVDPAGPSKKTAARGTSTVVVQRPREDSLPAVFDREVRLLLLPLLLFLIIISK